MRKETQQSEENLMAKSPQRIDTAISNKLGTTLYASICEVSTARPAFVLVHGLASASAEFGSLQEELAHAGFSSVSGDLSGHGKSSGTPGLITEASIIADVDALVTLAVEVGNGEVLVLGHSFGAYGALRALELDEVLAAVLIAPQQQSGDSLVGIKKKLFRILGLLYRTVLVLPDIYVRNKVDINAIAASGDERMALIEGNFFARDINLRILALASVANNEALVREAEKPVLFVACAEDKQIPVERVRTLFSAHQHPDAAFIELEKAGHSPFFGKQLPLLVKHIASFVEIIGEPNHR